MEFLRHTCPDPRQRRHALRYGVLSALLASAHIGLAAPIGRNLTEPRALHVGPFDLIPALVVRQDYNDDIFFSNLNRAASPVTLIGSGLRLARDYKEHRYSFDYALRSRTFWNSPRDDFVDHFFRGQTNLVITRRNRLSMMTDFTLNHDLRGTALSQGLRATLIKDPNRYRQVRTAWQYRFGAPTARGNVALDIGFLAKVYENNPLFTRSFSRQDIWMGPSFFYRIAPKTRLLFQFEELISQYDHPQPIRYDSDRQKYLVGATWQQTAKTTGTVKFGYLHQAFEDPQFKAVGGPTLEVGIDWRPKSYSTVTLNARRDTLPTIGFGTTQVFQEVELGWQHNWKPRLYSTLGASYGTIDYSQSRRKDDLLDVRVGLNYRMNDWIGFEVGYSLLKRTSTESVYDFTQNIFMLSISTNPSATVTPQF